MDIFQNGGLRVELPSPRKWAWAILYGCPFCQNLGGWRVGFIIENGHVGAYRFGCPFQNK